MFLVLIMKDVTITLFVISILRFFNCKFISIIFMSKTFFFFFNMIFRRYSNATTNYVNKYGITKMFMRKCPLLKALR